MRNQIELSTADDADERRWENGKHKTKIIFSFLSAPICVICGKISVLIRRHLRQIDLRLNA
jgi:hypothetical protein